MSFSVAFALAISTVTWQDLSAAAQTLAMQIGFARDSFAQSVASIRDSNAARLREGEIDHLIFYMLQSTDFTSELPIDPASAKSDDAMVRRRIAALTLALANPSDERRRYFATLIPQSGVEDFLESHTTRVLDWIHEKEIGCSAAASPQTCIAALYTTRGHSSDTSPQSLIAIEAAFDWLANRPFKTKRVLIIGPGSDFAPRTGVMPKSIQSFQPQALRKLTPGASIDCVDLNPRVVNAVRKECDASFEADIAVQRTQSKYDLIIATNILLYLNQKELLLAMQNIRSMLAQGAIFIHNDARFEAKLFGRAVGLPVLHFGVVTLEPSRRPPLIDHFVIHSPAEPKL